MYIKAKSSISSTAEAKSSSLYRVTSAFDGEIKLSPLLTYLQDIKSLISRICDGSKYIENMHIDHIDG